MKKQKNRSAVTSGRYQELLEYCLDRQISKKTLDAWRVSSRGNDALRFPLYQAAGGKWHNVNCKIKHLGRVHGKSKDTFEFSGHPTDLLIGNHLVNLGADEKRFILTEGQFDAMSFTELGFENVFSIPKGKNSAADAFKLDGLLRYLPNDWQLWLCFDSDESGQKAVNDVYAKFPMERIQIFTLPTKDLNQWHQDEPKLTKEMVLEYLKGCGVKQMFEVKQIETVNLGLETLMDEDSPLDKDTILATTPWAQLNDGLDGGFRPCETSSLLAPSGKGKSTIVRNIAINAAMSGVKVAMIDIEGNKSTKYLRKPIKGFLTLNNIFYDDKVCTHLNEHLKLSGLSGGDLTSADMINEAQRLADGGAEMIFIDNLDHISGIDEDEKFRTYRAIKKLASAGKHILFVWQCNKLKGAAEFVTSSDQKGYSRYFQDSDVYMNFNPAGPYRRLQVEKNRALDTMACIWFDYDKQLDWYSQLPEQPTDLIHPDDSRVKQTIGNPAFDHRWD